MNWLLRCFGFTAAPIIPAYELPYWAKPVRMQYGIPPMPFQGYMGNTAAERWHL